MEDDDFNAQMDALGQVFQNGRSGGSTTTSKKSSITFGANSMMQGDSSDDTDVDDGSPAESQRHSKESTSLPPPRAMRRPLRPETSASAAAAKPAVTSPLSGRSQEEKMALQRLEARRKELNDRLETRRARQTSPAPSTSIRPRAATSSTEPPKERPQSPPRRLSAQSNTSNTSQTFRSPPLPPAPLPADDSDTKEETPRTASGGAQLEKVRAALQEKEAHLAQTQSDMASVKEQNETLQKRLQTVEQRLKTMLTDAEEYAVLRSSHDDLDQQYKKAQQELHASRDEHQRALSTLKKSHSEVLEQLHDSEIEKQSILDEHAQHQSVVSDLKGKLAALEEEQKVVALYKEEKEAAEAERDSVQEKLDALTADMEVLQKEHVVLQREHDVLSKEHDLLTQEKSDDAAEEVAALEAKLAAAEKALAASQLREEEAFKERDEALNQVEALEAAAKEGQSDVRDTERIDALEKELAETLTAHEEAMAALKAEHEEAVAALQSEHEEAITSLQGEHDEIVSSLKEAHDEKVGGLQDDLTASQSNTQYARLEAEFRDVSDELELVSKELAELRKQKAEWANSPASRAADTDATAADSALESGDELDLGEAALPVEAQPTQRSVLRETIIRLLAEKKELDETQSHLLEKQLDLTSAVSDLENQLHQLRKSSAAEIESLQQSLAAGGDATELKAQIAELEKQLTDTEQQAEESINEWEQYAKDAETKRVAAEKALADYQASRDEDETPLTKNKSPTMTSQRSEGELLVDAPISPTRRRPSPCTTCEKHRQTIRDVSALVQQVQDRLAIE